MPTIHRLAPLLALLAACGNPGSDSPATRAAMPAPAAEGDAGLARVAAIPGPAPESDAGLVRAAAIPITGAATDYDALARMVGDARFVFLGEATHGTHEFYRERSRITERLVRELGFSGVVVEGDWPDAMRVDRFIRGGGPATPEAALAGFAEGFPQWMWANTDVRDMMRWMRAHNARPGRGVSFHGMDVYSLFESADSVLAHLRRADPAAARSAAAEYACFRPPRPDPQRYGASATGRATCQPQAERVAATMEARYAAGPADDAAFSAMQHARVVRGAEEYYRILYRGGASSWNRRDRHMAETLEAIAAHLERAGRPPKLVVWAHNTHSGDARHSDMAERGEVSVGQLMREKHGERAVLVGFTTYTGTVLAADEWDTPGRVRRLNPARADSYSGLFHQVAIPAFFLPLRGNAELRRTLAGPRLERAVGVVYAPRTELRSHYFPARMAERFDAVIHVDSTTAVTPLRR
jgi:erythromycin esterase-like protein